MTEINTDNALYQQNLITMLTSIHTDLAAAVADHNTLVAKLNADAGITDTDYADATALTTTVPS